MYGLLKEIRGRLSSLMALAQSELFLFFFHFTLSISMILMLGNSGCYHDYVTIVKIKAIELVNEHETYL